MQLFRKNFVLFVWLFAMSIQPGLATPEEAEKALLQEIDRRIEQELARGQIGDIVKFCTTLSDSNGCSLFDLAEKLEKEHALKAGDLRKFIALDFLESRVLGTVSKSSEEEQQAKERTIREKRSAEEDLIREINTRIRAELARGQIEEIRKLMDIISNRSSLWDISLFDLADRLETKYGLPEKSLRQYVGADFLEMRIMEEISLGSKEENEKRNKKQDDESLKQRVVFDDQGDARARRREFLALSKAQRSQELNEGAGAEILGVMKNAMFGQLNEYVSGVMKGGVPQDLEQISHAFVQTRKNFDIPIRNWIIQNPAWNQEAERVGHATFGSIGRFADDIIAMRKKEYPELAEELNAWGKEWKERVGKRHSNENIVASAKRGLVGLLNLRKELKKGEINTKDPRYGLKKPSLLLEFLEQAAYYQDVLGLITKISMKGEGSIDPSDLDVSPGQTVHITDQPVRSICHWIREYLGLRDGELVERYRGNFKQGVLPLIEITVPHQEVHDELVDRFRLWDEEMRLKPQVSADEANDVLFTIVELLSRATRPESRLRNWTLERVREACEARLCGALRDIREGPNQGKCAQGHSGRFFEAMVRSVVFPLIADDIVNGGQLQNKERSAKRVNPEADTAAQRKKLDHLLFKDELDFRWK